MTGPAPDSPQDLAAAYALGALAADEARRFEAYLATSPEAQREVAEYREVAALLALGGRGGRAVRRGLRDRVLARVAEQKTRSPCAAASRQPPPGRRRARGSRSPRACSLAVGLGRGAGLGPGPAGRGRDRARRRGPHAGRRPRSGSPSGRPRSTRSSSRASSCSSSPPAAIPSPASSCSGTAQRNRAIVARLPAQAGARRTRLPALVHQGRPAGALGHLQARGRRARQGRADPGARRRRAQRRGGHRRARGAAPPSRPRPS